MDHISVPLAQIQASLDVLCRGVLEHEPCDPDEIDAAVCALSGAHGQLGGETRQSLYELFASCRPGSDPDALSRSIEALAARLCPTRHARSATQLTLFGSAEEQKLEELHGCRRGSDDAVATGRRSGVPQIRSNP